ncbi:c-type cytochrome [Zhongshania arctica]|uniref:Cytochrome c5 family protein n=1 Tax=Zhongshania arctica TaxID=3238302 RepID=A0ABV3TRJ3_9GAMM
MRFKTSIYVKILSAGILLTGLTACTPDPNAKASSPAQSSRSLMPADPAIKTAYIQSCYGCHSSGAGRAPRTGNIADWAPRVQKGFDVLLYNTINGIGSMPAKGMCMDCSEEDFTKLILFLAGQSD